MLDWCFKLCLNKLLFIYALQVMHFSWKCYANLPESSHFVLGVLLLESTWKTAETWRESQNQVRSGNCCEILLGLTWYFFPSWYGWFHFELQYLWKHVSPRCKRNLLAEIKEFARVKCFFFILVYALSAMVSIF